MPIDTSIIAPRGNAMQPPTGGGMPPMGRALAGGMPAGQMGGQGGPGQMEALRAAIQALQKQGMEPEQILEMLLKIVERLGIDIPEEQLRELIMNAGATPTGGQMPAGGGMPMGEMPAQGV